MKPEKVKSRWRRNSEMETEEPSTEMSSESITKYIADNEDFSIDSEKFPSFELLEENLYLFERKKTKRKKEVRRMRCECVVKPNEPACGEECLNRLLMIECGSRCITGEACSNRRFEKKLYVKTQPFKTDKKGYGLKVLEDVPKGKFIIEYVGEVLNRTEFKKRVKHYAREKEEHYYFMALKIDEIIDARYKANLSRFINHSCNPNCETQKWTVNGELRIGFFAKCDIKANQELTFDYKLERYGRQAEKCYCKSENCKGFIGVSDEITVDIETKKENKNRRKKSAEKEKDEKYESKKDILEDIMLEEELEKLSVNAGLRNKDDTLMLARLMVRAEDSHFREKLLNIILGTTEVACLRLFLDYHGLTLFWSWMVDLKDLTDFPLKKKILKALALLPVPNRTMLSDSKVLCVVEKWASCSTSVGDEEHESTKIKSCDTSDSETEHFQNVFRTFSEGENLINFPRDRTHISNCVVNISKAINCLEKTGDNSGGDEESFSDNKTSDTNLRSDEESGDNTLEEKDENLEDRKCTLHTAEITSLAQNLLDSWKDLKETFRIPRLEKREDEDVREHSKSSTQSVISPNRKTKVKNTIIKGNSEEKSSMSEKLQEERKKIEVHCKDYSRDLKYKQKKPRTSYEKRTSYNRKSPPRERRAMQNNFNAYYQYDTSDYSHSKNYNYSSTGYAGENDFHHCAPQSLQQNESHIYKEDTCSPQPTYLPAQATLPNMGISPNIVCAVQPQTPVTTSPHVLPNVMFPPPANQLPFLNLPPPTIPSVVPEHSANIGPCSQSNNIVPAHHLVGMPGVPSPILPMQISASSSEQAGYVRTESTFHNENSVIGMETVFPITHNPEHIYSSITQENEETPRQLPPNWKTAKDPEGNIYFYHIKTRQTQWDPPEMDENVDIDSTPTYDEPKERKHESHSRRSHKKKHSKRKSTTTAAADTSSRDNVNSEITKKIKELFRTKMSSYIIQCLNPYRRDDCKVARITSNEDFKHLARKLTHFVMAKEIKHCKNIEDLDANDSVKLKAKDYIRKYMDRYGSVYRKEKLYSSVTADTVS